LAECQKQKRTVAVALKETGLHQIAAQLRDPGRLARFLRIVAQADGCVATTPEAAEIFCRVRRERHADTVAFIPTPYPLEDEQWKFAVAPNEQSGIFIGTREWDVPSRNISRRFSLPERFAPILKSPSPFSISTAEEAKNF